jgi:hypothetical protein
MPVQGFVQSERASGWETGWGLPAPGSGFPSSYITLELGEKFNHAPYLPDDRGSDPYQGVKDRHEGQSTS